ncbi:hypothetical protein NQ317_002910 [Molorchus minor]|uniref:Uncharacterized protein n=1 Tax=Molorchus minor TaxID=1323400 RepID=A0ABQ9IV04_9CUCU|nr:hypothetical protein NQ317_002910 [Molorchus minor]
MNAVVHSITVFCVLASVQASYEHGGHDISHTVEVTKHVPVPVYKHEIVKLPHTVPVPIPKPVAVPVPQPYPVHVKIPQPFAVPVIKTITIPVEKPVPYKSGEDRPLPRGEARASARRETRAHQGAKASTKEALDEIVASVESSIHQEVVNEYINLIKLCMKQNCFQFNNSFFEQHEGTAMGNSLSPFIANLFMSRFEIDIKEEFEKDTSTLRYIPNDSHHCYQHKMASLNFLVHRLLSFPLSKERFEKEKID